MQEFEEQEEEIDDFTFSFLEIQINEDIFNQVQAVIIAQLGAPSIYINQHLAKANCVGQVLQKTNNSLKLATIKCVDQLLFIVFERDIRYYHYQEYNLLQELESHGLKEQQIFILMNVTASSLERYTNEESDLRQLNYNIPSQLKQLEDADSLEGYFGELFYSLNKRKALAIILVQTNFDLSIDIIQKYRCIQTIIPALICCDNKEFIKDQIKKYNKESNKSSVHI